MLTIACIHAGSSDGDLVHRCDGLLTTYILAKCFLQRVGSRYPTIG